MIINNRHRETRSQSSEHCLSAISFPEHGNSKQHFLQSYRALQLKFNLLNHSESVRLMHLESTHSFQARAQAFSLGIRHHTLWIFYSHSDSSLPLLKCKLKSKCGMAPKDISPRWESQVFPTWRSWWWAINMIEIHLRKFAGNKILFKDKAHGISYDYQ